MARVGASWYWRPLRKGDGGEEAAGKLAAFVLERDARYAYPGVLRRGATRLPAAGCEGLPVGCRSYSRAGHRWWACRRQRRARPGPSARRRAARPVVRKPQRLGWLGQAGWMVPFRWRRCQTARRRRHRPVARPRPAPPGRVRDRTVRVTLAVRPHSFASLLRPASRGTRSRNHPPRTSRQRHPRVSQCATTSQPWPRSPLDGRLSPAQSASAVVQEARISIHWRSPSERMDLPHRARARSGGGREAITLVWRAARRSSCRRPRPGIAR